MQGLMNGTVYQQQPLLLLCVPGIKVSSQQNNIKIFVLSTDERVSKFVEGLSASDYSHVGEEHLNIRVPCSIPSKRDIAKLTSIINETDKRHWTSGSSLLN